MHLCFEVGLELIDEMNLFYCHCFVFNIEDPLPIDDILRFHTVYFNLFDVLLWKLFLKQ